MEIPQFPCTAPDSWPVWTFIVVAVLSHARGTALLVREVLSWLTARHERRGRRRTPRM